MFHMKFLCSLSHTMGLALRCQDLVQVDSRELQEREGHMSEQAEASSSGCSSGSSTRGAGRLLEDPQLVSLSGQRTAVMRLVPASSAMVQAGLSPEEALLRLSIPADDAAGIPYSPGMLEAIGLMILCTPPACPPGPDGGCSAPDSHQSASLLSAVSHPTDATAVGVSVDCCARPAANSGTNSAGYHLHQLNQNNFLSCS